MSKRKKGNDDAGEVQDVKYGILDMNGVVINAEAGDSLNFRKAMAEFSLTGFVEKMSLKDLGIVQKTCADKRYFKTDYGIKNLAMCCEQMKLLGT